MAQKTNKQTTNGQTKHGQQTDEQIHTHTHLLTYLHNEEQRLMHNMFVGYHIISLTSRLLSTLSNHTRGTHRACTADQETWS